MSGQNSVRYWFGLALVLAIGAPTLGQDESGKVDQTNPSQTKPARKKFSELRGDDKIEPSKTEAPKAEAKKPAEPESTAVGFFGDTKKFTRLGGWGSFGNAMGQFGFAKTTLIMMPPVQEELKLTDDQKKKIREWQEGLRKKGEEMGRAMREKNGPDPFKAAENQPITARIGQFTSMMNQVGSFLKENENGLAKILNAPQRKRLSQISLQMEGITALTKPEIVEALGMVDEEVEQVQQILNQSRAQQTAAWIGSMMSMRPPRPNPSAASASDPKAKAGEPANPEVEAKARAAREKAMKQNFETMRDRTDQIQNQAVKQISEVLSKAQRAKFESLMGPPFDPKKINNLGGPPRRDGAPTDSEPKPPADKKTP
jgi:hypothetical protein